MATEEAQQTAGIQAPPAITLDDHLNSVFSKGTLAAVHISKMTWHQTLEPVDYGLEKFPENFKAGHRVLLEGDVVEAIAKAESQARHWLKKTSLKFPVELIRFVPKNRIMRVLAEFEEHKRKFDALVLQLIEQYPQLKEHAREKYPDQWHRMAEAYPTVEKIQGRHSMTFETFEYAFPRAFDRAGASLDRVVADQQYRTEQQVLIERQQAQARATMTQFVEQTVRDLRGRVVERFRDVLANSRGGQAVTGRTLSSIRTMLQEVRDLDIVGDNGFQAQVREVEQQLEGANSRTFQDSASALAALDQALTGVVEYASQTTDGAVQSLTAGFMTGKRRLTL